MPIPNLPSRLRKEPLVDVVFEMRFTSTMPASVVLPGMFLTRLHLEGGEKAIQRLPLYDLPEEIRRREQGMRYQTLLRVDWGDYMLLVGDSHVGIGCKMPYRGWSDFRARILEIVDVMKESRIVNRVERYALKYVDLIPGASIGEQLSRLNLNINIGTHSLSNENFKLHLELPRDEFTHLINVGAPAQARLHSGEERKGALVDIDSIYPVKFEDWGCFLEALPGGLDRLHEENKAIFFECLTEETVNFLEPQYDE